MPADPEDVLAAVERQDWDALRLLLHPYLHWRTPDGRALRGRRVVLAELEAQPTVAPPARIELRDGQVYRWVS